MQLPLKLSCDCHLLFAYIATLNLCFKTVKRALRLVLERKTTETTKLIRIYFHVYTVYLFHTRFKTKRVLQKYDKQKELYLVFINIDIANSNCITTGRTDLKASAHVTKQVTQMISFI